MPKTSQRLGLKSIPPIEERRATRRQPPAVEVYMVLAGDETWRFHYSIAYSIEHGEVWAPWIGNEISFLPSSDGDLTCVWPHEALGVRASKDYKTPVSIDPIPLDIWIDTFLDVEFRQDNLKVMLCPTAKHGTPRSVDEILREIERYVTDREAYWREHFSVDQFTLVGPQGRPIGKLPG